MLISSRSKSRSPSNFIYENINYFSTATRTISEHDCDFSVSGVSIALETKEGNQRGSKKQHVKFVRKLKTDSNKPQQSGNGLKTKHEKPSNTISTKAINITKSDKSVRSNSIVPIIGVRRTVIRPKLKKKAIEDSISTKTSDVGKNRPPVQQRESLNLPISWIPVPEHPPVYLIDILLKLLLYKIKYKGNQEALNRRVEVLERILASMEVSGHTRHCSEHQLEGDINLSNLTLNDKQDQSYEHIYQRHVDELNSVISCSETGQSHLSVSPDGKPKKKALPKLEIKLGTTEQLAIAESGGSERREISDDNPGDLTPVITYNHVSTISTQNEFLHRVADLSPGSSIGSRSPSPLLEVPQTPGEIFTKFPTDVNLISPE